MVQSEFNWFEVVARVEALVVLDDSDAVMTQLSSSIDKLLIGKKEKQMLEISREAFLAEEFNSFQKTRHADVVNGCIVTDSESDDPDTIEKAQSPLLQDVIQKRRGAIKRQMQRLKAKCLEEQCFLRRRINRKVKGIVKDYPDIGQTIEEFVKSCNVGPDAWRRTGVLTFDGNRNVKQKVTYERIRQHLELQYGRHFSYGTVVQLCLARNQRHKSALRYKGVAQVTTRRARKGFEIRYNPDCHWRSSLYRGLDFIQYADGRDILNINRDDASGFRLDTLFTHKQYASPQVKGCDILTTYTDYIKRYPSTLQTTSYNFTKTNTTRELCAGVVKAVPIFPKSSAQHAADLKMFQLQPNLPLFIPRLEIIRRFSVFMLMVLQMRGHLTKRSSWYWWCLEHLQMERLATLVTACSGSSHLNRVEL